MTETGRADFGSAVPDGTDSSPSAEPGSPPLSGGEWKERRALVRRAFPGPRGVEIPLRVAFERRAYADLVAHAKDSLESEIGGVLVGSPCRDQEGGFVHVAAVIRATYADEGSRHVTFTQETWNTIHAAMERDHPKLQIVGWYHSHPGFGVEFSEMDVFIQKNFFAGALQIGLVTDPLGGDIAICMNADDGIRYLPRFWVDAREQKCRLPLQATTASGEAIVAPAGSPDAVAALETRISQLIHTVDDMRRTFYRWVYALGMLTGLAIILFISRQVSWLVLGELPKPPSHISFAAIPLRIDGKACLIGVDVVSWQVPPELLYVLPSKDQQDGDQEKDEPEERNPEEKPASSSTGTNRDPAQDPAADPPARKGSRQ